MTIIMGLWLIMCSQAGMSVKNLTMSRNWFYADAVALYVIVFAVVFRLIIGCFTLVDKSDRADGSDTTGKGQ